MSVASYMTTQYVNEYKRQKAMISKNCPLRKISNYLGNTGFKIIGEFHPLGLALMLDNKVSVILKHDESDNFDSFIEIRQIVVNPLFGGQGLFRDTLSKLFKVADIHSFYYICTVEPLELNPDIQDFFESPLTYLKPVGTHITDDAFIRAWRDQLIKMGWIYDVNYVSNYLFRRPKI